MIDLNYLNGNISESSFYALYEIFERAKNAQDKKTIKELESELFRVLQNEKSLGLHTWSASPNGNNHIIVANNLCLFINIYGINYIFDNWLFYDGELRILNFNWNESDSTVTFDIHYIVHNIWEKCICRFMNKDFSAKITPYSKNYIDWAGIVTE